MGMVQDVLADLFERRVEGGQKPANPGQHHHFIIQGIAILTKQTSEKIDGQKIFSTK
jgi:hypothetical protein